jgi:hypothetical protein
MTEIQMTETKKLLEPYQLYLAPFRALEYWNFERVSDFGIRISNLFNSASLGSRGSGSGLRQSLR